MFVPVFSLFPPILLKNFGSDWDGFWLVIFVIKLPRVSLIALKGGIGIIIAHAYYPPPETVIIGYPV